MKINKCRICKKKKLTKLFSLGNLCFTGKFPSLNQKIKKKPINLVICKNCELVQLGYNFDLRTLDKNTGYQKTNCIWFGAGVPLSDVKKVAIALIQSGNTVKGIKRFPLSKKNSSYKRNIIEVGMEINYENYYSKPLSIVEVERAKNFK